MGLEKSGWKFTIPEFIDDGEDSLIINFPDGQVKYVPERTCKNVSTNGNFECSVCGCFILEDDLSYMSGRGAICFLRHYANHCPDCGAKVVG